MNMTVGTWRLVAHVIVMGGMLASGATVMKYVRTDGSLR